MKHLFTCLMLVLLCGTLSAQDDEPGMRFLTDGDIPITGFGGPIAEFSAIDGNLAIGLGGGGGILFHRNFFLGGYGMGLYNDIDRSVGDTLLSLDYGGGGMWIGYLNRAHDLVHLGLSTKIGWGSMELNNETGQEVSQDQMFMVTPQLEMEVNVAPFVKLNFGVGVRIASGLRDNEYYDDRDFSSPVGSASILFGWFDD